MPELAHIPCPDTDCGSSDAYSFNTDKGVGHCFSCGQSFFDQHEPLKRPKGDTNVAFDNPTATTPHEYLPLRGIQVKTMEFYDVRSYRDANGELTKQEYIYPSGGKKIRVMPKTFSASGLSQDELFGMNLFPAGSASIVTITEGELDALSAHQMLNVRGTNPVVSLPSATPSKRLWEK